MTRFFIGALVAGLALAAPVAGNARPYARWCEGAWCFCKKLNDYGYDFWSARLDEADAALDAALEYTEDDLAVMGKMIQENPNEMKFVSCGWGKNKVLTEKLRDDHTIQLSDELQTIYEEVLETNGAKPSAFWFLVNSLRKAESCHDFKIKAIAMRAQDIYNRRFYSRACPF